MIRAACRLEDDRHLSGRHGGDIFDDSEAFWKVQARMGWPAGLCEGSFYQTDDGVLHMLLRTTGPAMRASCGSPKAATTARPGRRLWKRVSPTTTPSSTSAGCPTDGRPAAGRYYYVGCPDPRAARGAQPAGAVAVRGRRRFDRHFILADEEYTQRRPGLHKGGLYGYPHTMIHDGYLYVIVSLRKEAVAVLRVALSAFM